MAWLLEASEQGPRFSWCATPINWSLHHLHKRTFKPAKPTWTTPQYSLYGRQAPAPAAAALHSTYQSVKKSHDALLMGWLPLKETTMVQSDSIEDSHPHRQRLPKYYCSTVEDYQYTFIITVLTCHFTNLQLCFWLPLKSTFLRQTYTKCTKDIWAEPLSGRINRFCYACCFGFCINVENTRVLARFWGLGSSFCGAGKLTISCPTNTVVNSVNTMGSWGWVFVGQENWPFPAPQTLSQTMWIPWGDILGSSFCGAGKLTISCPTKTVIQVPAHNLYTYRFHVPILCPAASPVLRSLTIYQVTRPLVPNI